MSADYEEPLPDSEKARIVNHFLLQSPPGELKEVLNDVRILLNDDSLLKEQATVVFPQYCKEQLTPITLENSGHSVLVSEFNALSEGRYSDPRSKQSFKVDCLKEEATDIQTWISDPSIESWRSSLEEAMLNYCKEHYFDGVCSVFGSHQNGLITLTACIEDHQFQPKNFWNGRWRSIWTTSFTPTSEKVELKGLIKVHVHYYEDGNVQLVSSKEIERTLNITNESQLANDFVHNVEESENEYQLAVSENYQTMSDTTFKALRRPLPVTKAKLDWHRLLNYRIGSEFKQH